MIEVETEKLLYLSLESKATLKKILRLSGKREDI